MTLAELRHDPVWRQGRAVVNGLPYVDGADVLCVVCRQPVGEDEQVDAERLGKRWSVSHDRCSDG